MTRQEKILLLVVLIASGVGATYYVQNSKSNNASIVQQVQQPVEQTVTTPVTNTTVTAPDTTTSVNINTDTNTNTGTANTNTNTTTSVTKNLSTTVRYSVPEGANTLSVNLTTKDGLYYSSEFFRET